VPADSSRRHHPQTECFLFIRHSAHQSRRACNGAFTMLEKVMRPILVLLFAIVFPLIAEAQDGHYQWTASVGLEKGHATVCGSQDPRVIEIKNGLFKGADIVDGGTWTLPIRRLNADGSGRIVAYESRSKEENLFDFDAGIGPRPIRQTTNRGACVWAWMPMTADAAADAAAEARKESAQGNGDWY
jgi:hypothetical protein